MAGIKKGNQVSLKTTNEFISLIPTLKLNELLEIEFRIDNVWKKMVVCRNQIQKMYHCNVCNVVQYGEKNLFGHLVGKKHKSQMVSVKQLYLSKYTQSKNANESALNYKTQRQGNIKPTKVESSTAAVRAANSKNTVGTVAKRNNNTQATPTTAKVIPIAKLAVTVEEQISKAGTQSNSTKASPPTPADSIAKITPTKTAAPTLKLPPARATPVKTNNLPLKTETESSKTTAEKKTPPNTKIVQEKVMAQVPITTPSNPQVHTGTIPVKVTSPISTSVPAKTTAACTKVTPAKILNEIPTCAPAETTSVNLKAEPVNVTATSASAAAAKATPLKITVQATMEKPNRELISPKTETVKLSLKSADTAPIENSKVYNIEKEPNFGPTKNIDPALSAATKQKQSVDRGASSVTDMSNDSLLLAEGSEQLLKDEEVVRADEIILENSIVENSNKEKCLITCKSFAKLMATDSLPTEVINIDDDDEDDANVDVGQVIKDAAVSLNELSERQSACAGANSANEKVVSKDANANKKKDSEMPLSRRAKRRTANEESKKLDAPQQTPNYTKNPNITPTVASKNTRQTIVRKKSQQRDDSDSEIITFDSDSSNVRYREDIEGLVGVEYVLKIKLNSFNDKSKRYECCLCELVLTGRAMQHHLLGYNHRLKFCEKHFPTAIRQYRQYMIEVPEHEIFKVMTPILDKLAIAIEEHHGRERPFQCYDREYTKNRSNYISKVFSSRHASEQHGPSFTHVIDAKEVDQLIQNRHNFRPRKSMYVQKADERLGESTVTTCEISGYEQQHDQQEQQCLPQHMVPQDNIRHIQHSNQETGYVDDETHRLMVEDFLKGTNMGEGRHDRGHLHRNRARDRSRSPSRGRKRRRSRSNSRSSQSARKYKCKSISPLRDGDIWQAYRHMVDQKLRELENVFDQYKMDPETHPLYKEQWQKFWKRRKDELIAAGIDHRKYNYQNEWVLFFKARMEQLHSQDVETVKIQCRERLYLPMVNDEVPDTKYHVHVLINQETAFNVAIPNIPTSYQAQPMADDSEAIDSDEEPMDTEEQIQEMPNNQVPNVIHVLRILTALEEFLGSLGPKITEMLSKALVLDKTNPADVDLVFNTHEHCAVLETAKEKFKGLVIAGLLDAPKDRALRKAISETDRFLIFTLEKIKAAENQRHMEISQNQQFGSRAPPSSTFFASQTMPFNPYNAAVPAAAVSTAPQLLQNPQVLEQNQTEQAQNLTESEKNNLAAKLASSLVAQGKTNFEASQLRQIIEIYSIIEKRKREENQMPSATINSNNVGQNTLLDALTQFTTNTGFRGDSGSGRSSLSAHTVNSARNNQTNVQFNERGTSSSLFQSNINSTSSLQSSLNSNWRTSIGNGGYGGFNSGNDGFTARGSNTGIGSFTPRGSSTNLVGSNNSNARVANINISGSYAANTTERSFSNTNTYTNMNNMNTSGSSFSQNAPSTSRNFSPFYSNQTQLQGLRGLSRNSGQLFDSEHSVESFQDVPNQSISSQPGNSVWSNNNTNSVTENRSNVFNPNQSFLSKNNTNLNIQSNNFRRGGDQRHIRQRENRFN